MVAVVVALRQQRRRRGKKQKVEAFAIVTSTSPWTRLCSTDAQQQPQRHTRAIVRESQTIEQNSGILKGAIQCSIHCAIACVCMLLC